MTRLPLLAAATAALILLTGCGGSGSDTAAEPVATTDTPTTGATTAPSTEPEPEPTKTTPSATPTPTPAVTTTATDLPTGTLIDYGNSDENGATIAVAADTGKLAGSPADFKSFIASQLAAATPGEGCTEQPQMYVTRVDTGGWALGGYFIPQCGGYAALWAKSKGSWQEVWSGQSLVECTTLTKYGFPAAVAGGECLDGDKTVDYSG
ncbi:MAG: hypothetical protein ABW004_06690 [Aeromicrobium sp.]